MIKFILTGHVDHGKSTLGGHLLYKCGAIDEREKNKTFDTAQTDKKMSFKWARLLDTQIEEQDRGITIECNEINFNFKDKDFKLIDTPGHKLFIRNLIKAVYDNCSNNIIGVLVISSIPGEFFSSINNGQVKEDLSILRAIGVKKLVIAINKMDYVQWDEEKYSHVKREIGPIIKQLNYQQIKFCAVSGFNGDGLIDISPLNTPSLIDTLLSFTFENEANFQTGEISCNQSEFKAKIIISDCKFLTVGYSGILHTIKGEHNFVIEKIQTKKFLKTGDRDTIIFHLNENLQLRNGDRIILRNNDQTIAFGLIIN